MTDSPTKLYQRHWANCNTANIKAVVLLIHGLGEHCERYQALGRYLNDNDYILCSFDLSGHGQSSGKRGHIDQFSDYEDAALSLFGEIKQQYPEKPIFLLGHSMGGLIAARLLIEQQHLFKGALLSGTAIQTLQEPPAWQVAIISLISKLFPTAGILKLDASAVSRNPSVVEKYKTDPLVHHGKLSARLLVEMFKAMNDCKAQASKITLPIKIMHGADDMMTAPEGSQFIFNHVSSNDKTLTIYEGLYHEIFNEPESLKIYTEIVDWLNTRLSFPL